MLFGFVKYLYTINGYRNRIIMHNYTLDCTTYVSNDIRSLDFGFTRGGKFKVDRANDIVLITFAKPQKIKPMNDFCQHLIAKGYTAKVFNHVV